MQQPAAGTEAVRLSAALWFESRLALRFLGDHRLQTLLIVTGIAVGAAVIVFITALITGLQANIIERTLGSQSHIRFLPPDEVNLRVPLPPGVTALAEELPRAQRLRSIVNWQELLAALDADPALAAVSPLLSGPALARRGVARNSIVLMGIDAARYLRIAGIDRDLVAGSFNVDAGQAVIGSELAADLGLAVGDKLRLDGGDGRDALVQVSGIFTLGQRELDERYVYMNLKQAQTLLNLPGGVTVIDATVPELFEADRIAQQLGRRTGLKAESWMQSNGDLLNALRSQSLSTQMISIFVGISVAFGIASVLAVSVVQRTREIGILRAMGSQRGQIQRVFLLQGALLGCGGSLLGAAVGWGLVQIFNIAGPGLFYVPVDPVLVPAAVLLATLTGLLAALAPARRAAHYDPAEAIRYV